MRSTRYRAVVLILGLSLLLFPIHSFAPDTTPTPDVTTRARCWAIFKVIAVGATGSLAGLLATSTVGEPVLQWMGWKKSIEQHVADGVVTALEEQEKRRNEINEILPASGTHASASPELVRDAELALELARTQLKTGNVPDRSAIAATLFDRQKPELLAKIKSDLGKSETDPLTVALLQQLKKKAEQLVEEKQLDPSNRDGLREAITDLRMWWEQEIRKERLLGR